MQNQSNCPRMRWPVDIRFETVEDQSILILTCPLGITEKPLCLNGALAPIIATFEGLASIEQITAKFAPYGATAELIKSLVSLLDEHLFLATPRFF